MAQTTEAKANPEKRLFISLLTRDIPLADAFLDLIDNSLNSALAAHAGRLKDAQSYISLLESNKQKADPTEIHLTVGNGSVVIEDFSGGISFVSARDHVFQFGRGKEKRDSSDRLSVYGVGLKRAIFKIGNHIKMVSNHRDGGFSTDLKVDKWEEDPRQPWVIDISQLPPGPAKVGTKIEIKELYSEVKNRIGDGLFIDELKTKIQRTYEFYLNKTRLSP
jgi:Histidine kinase-, DNA gyrase B-, and HSP90-like ATPase